MKFGEYFRNYIGLTLVAIFAIFSIYQIAKRVDYALIIIIVLLIIILSMVWSIKNDLKNVLIKK